MLKHAFPLVSSKRGELYQHTRSRVTSSQQTHTHRHTGQEHKQTRGVKAGSTLLEN